MRRILVDEARRLFKLFTAVLACTLALILVLFLLEVVAGLECRVAHPIAFTFAIVLFVLGYLLPIEAGIRYCHRTK